jgi:hypothetical protein
LIAHSVSVDRPHYSRVNCIELFLLCLAKPDLRAGD